jgi:putative PIN family toxin of toxin-antitoxin system
MRSEKAVRVIIDTNILVSGLISGRGAPAKIVDAVLQGRIIPVMSTTTFEELEEVLSRPQLQTYFKRAQVSPQDFLANLKNVAEVVHPKPVNINIRDHKDRPFIELTMTEPEPEYLITGDKDFEQDRYAGSL